MYHHYYYQQNKAGTISILSSSTIGTCHLTVFVLLSVSPISWSFHQNWFRGNFSLLLGFHWGKPMLERAIAIVIIFPVSKTVWKIFFTYFHVNWLKAWTIARSPWSNHQSIPTHETVENILVPLVGLNSGALQHVDNVVPCNMSAWNNLLLQLNFQWWLLLKCRETCSLHLQTE